MNKLNKKQLKNWKKNLNMKNNWKNMETLKK
jgi:hypothetical protein